MNKITATGSIKDGVLKINNRRIFDADLLKIKGEVNITVQATGKKRTSKQNRYYWGVVVKIIREGLLDIGYDLNDDDVHEFLKSKFNPTSIIFELTGEEFTFGASTTKMNTKAFKEYIEKIQLFGSQYLSVFIPDPI